MNTLPADARHRPPTGRRWRLAVLAGILILAGIAIAFWLAVRAYAPALTRERIQAALGEALGRPVRIQRVVLQPWRRRVVLMDVSVASGPSRTGAPMLRLARAEVTAGIRSLWELQVVLSRIRLTDLDLALTAGPSESTPPPLVLSNHFQAGPISLRIEEIVLQHGRISYSDSQNRRNLLVQDLEARLRLSPRETGVSAQAGAIRFIAPGVDERLDRLQLDGRTLPDRIAIQSLSARWQGRELSLRGEVRHPLSAPDLSLRLQATVDLADLGRRTGLHVGLAGIATLQADLQGALASPRAAVRVAVPDLGVGPVAARGVQVTGEVRGPVAAPDIRLAARGEVDLARLGRALQLPLPLGGTATADLTLRGALEAPELGGQITIPDLTAGPVKAQRVSVRGLWAGGTLQVERITANLFGGSLDGSLRMRPDRLQETSLRVAFRQIALPALKTLIPRAPRFGGTLDLQAEVAGDPRDPASLRGRLSLEGAGLRLPGGLDRAGAGSLSAQATLRDQLLEIHRLTAVWPGLHGQASGGVGLSGPATLRLQAQGDLGVLGPIWGLPDVAGTVLLTAGADGRWPAPQITGRLLAPSLNAAGTRVDRISIPFQLRDRRLEVTGAELTLGQSPVTATGALSWTHPGLLPLDDWPRSVQGRLGLRAPAVRLEDLDRWIPPAWRGTGQLAVTLHLAGSPAAWDGSGSLAADRLLGPDRIPIQDLRAAVKADSSRLEVTALRAKLRGVPVDGHGTWEWAGAGRAEADLGPLDLAAIPEAPERLALRGEARGRLQATYRNGAVSAGGTFHLAAASALGLPPGNGELTLSLQRGELRAMLSLPAARLAGQLEGRLGARPVLTAHLTVQDLALGPIIRRSVPGQTVPLDGQLSLTAAATIPTDRPSATRATLELYPVRLLVVEERWESPDPVLLRWEGGAVHVDRLRLTSRLGTLAVSGSADPAGKLSLALRGAFPLGILPALLPQVHEAGGTLEATLDATGMTAAPQLSGEATVRQGRIQIQGYPDALREVQARFLLSSTGIRLVEATGALGRGRLQASGEATLQGWQVRFYRLSVAGRNISLPPTDQLETTWDVDLELAGLGPRAQLSGTAHLVRGRYAGQLSLRSLLFGKEKAQSGGAAFALPIKILLQLDNNLMLETELARMRVGGTLSVEGTTASPALFGSLEVREGSILFRKHQFTVTLASAQFSDPRRVDPTLNVQATTQIQDYQVTMSLSGRADNLTVHLSSSPPLSQEDLLTLVTFGVTREEFGRSAAGIVAGEAAQLLVQEFLGLNTTSAGLDVFEVESTASGGHTLRVGKTVAKGTLLIFEQPLSGTGTQKLRVEYQVLGPLLITGEQSFQGGYGADLLLRLSFR